MAFTGNYMVTSFKKELLGGYHKFRAAGGHTFKIALYDESASFNATTTDYTVTNEISGTGYTAGGQVLVPTDAAQGGTTGWVDFADVVWTGTLSARGALVYNTTYDDGSGTTNAVLVLDFGSTRSVVADDFRVVMPSPDELNAILRIK